MLPFMIILSLTLNACVGELDTLDMLYPDQPCTEAKNQNAYNTFLNHHLREDTPLDPNDQEKWQKFIDEIDTWDRPIQSFFPFSEKIKVIAVCSSGGKQYSGNLCISKKPIKFFTVEMNKKQVKRVKFQNQHVILACDKIKIDNKCLPIHFEANKKDVKPDNNKPDCSEATANYSLYSF